MPSFFYNFSFLLDTTYETRFRFYIPHYHVNYKVITEYSLNSVRVTLFNEISRKTSRANLKAIPTKTHDGIKDTRSNNTKASDKYKNFKIQ